MKISFSQPALPEAGALVVGVLDERALSPSAQRLDEAAGGAVRRAIEAGRFNGRNDQTLLLRGLGGIGLDLVLLLGLGKASELDALRLQAAGGRLYAAIAPDGVKSAVVAIDAVDGCPLPPSAMAAEVAFGATLRSYRFAKYRTKEKAEEKPRLKKLDLRCADPDRAAELYQDQAAVADAVAFTRDLVSEPGNVIYPETLAAAARELEKLGVEVEVLGESEMKKLGMNALLSVGQGSDRESLLVVLQWAGAGKGGKKKARDGAAPIAFVGKGVTFDTGGISIKPSGGMEEMKYDMAGAGAVIGLMRALASRKAKVDAVGVVGLVENMPSGKAQRPGDIWTTLSGQTVEVINTDAEGRLVLCDALYYTRDRFKPKAMIDVATLTGAIVVALGNETAGLFSNNDALAEHIADAARRVGEPVWRMPLAEAYDKLIKSDAADMKNVGNRAAGSITAAQFLQRFVGDTPWAHLDIAGVAWTKEARDVVPKGATGFGIRLLDRLVADHYEAD
jgi:leucyl aminopeptidase